MGADGHILIWEDAKVRAEFTDCDELFRKIPTHYQDGLNGTLYHHCYWGDNLSVDWECHMDWFGGYDSRLADFVKWLAANGTEWEVWT